MTTLHPVRPAPGTDRLPPGGSPSSAGAPLAGADLLAALLAGTPEEDQPVTHVHRMPVRDSRTLPWPDSIRSRMRVLQPKAGIPYGIAIAAGAIITSLQLMGARTA